MLVVLLIVLGALAVLAIAMFAVGNVVRRLGPEPARQVFDNDEALSFVAEALPGDVTAVLSYEDVQRILRLHLDFLHGKGVARSGGDLPAGDGPVVIDADDGVDYVIGRAALRKFAPERQHVAAVIAAQLAYFEAIGAMSEVEGPDLSTGPTGPALTVVDPATGRVSGPTSGAPPAADAETGKHPGDG